MISSERTDGEEFEIGLARTMGRSISFSRLCFEAFHFSFPFGSVARSEVFALQIHLHWGFSRFIKFAFSSRRTSSSSTGFLRCGVVNALPQSPSSQSKRVVLRILISRARRKSLFQNHLFSETCAETRYFLALIISRTERVRKVFPWLTPLRKSCKIYDGNYLGYVMCANNN